MNEKKTDKSVEFFERYTNWIESQDSLQIILKFFRKYFLAATFVSLVLIGSIHFASTLLNETKKSSPAIEEQRQTIAKMFQQILHLEKNVNSLQKEILFLKKYISLHDLKLHQVNIQGKSFKPSGKTIWISQPQITLSNFVFQNTIRKNFIYVQEIISGEIKLNDQAISLKNSLQKISLELTAGLDSYDLQILKLRFKDISGTIFSGAGSLTIKKDNQAPILKKNLTLDHLRIHIQDQESGWKNLRLTTLPHQQIFEASQDNKGIFSLEEKEEGVFLSLPWKDLGSWESIQVLAFDMTGNTSQTEIKQLPRPKIDMISGKSVSLPVVLPVSSSQAPEPLVQSRIFLEKYQNGSFEFFKDVTAGPINLGEGLYRAKAFFQEDSFRGPFSDSILFTVDNTAPTGKIILEKKDTFLHWEIETYEENIEIQTTVRANQKILALNIEGKQSKCEISNDFPQVEVQVTLKDAAGNETKITKTWTP